MEDGELRPLQTQLPILPPIPPYASTLPGSSITVVAGRRSSITATLNDGPDAPSPRLALFTSPLLPQQADTTQQSADKRKRRLRSSVVHTKQQRTPRSLKLQHHAHSSPFNLTSPLHHLSLLSPRQRAPHVPSAIQSRSAPQSPAFLRPLRHMSSLGLTLSPPTLNWTVAAGVLSEAEMRSSEMLCREMSVNVERVIAVDRLIGVDMCNQVQDLEGEERRVRDKQWREVAQVRRAKDDGEREEQRSLIIDEIRRNQAHVDAVRSSLVQQRYLDWRYRDESAEADEMADDQRLARYDAYTAAQLRVSLNKQEESAAWKNEWRAIQQLQQQRMAEERAAALARQQAERQRINAAYTAARLKAKQGRLQLTIVRAKAIATPFLPANTVAYFVAQLVSDPPAQSLDYPAPLSELRYTPFVAFEAGEEAHDGEEGEQGEENVGMGVEVGWSCEWAVKSVGKTTLLIGWQCCDREQKSKFDKWVRKKERHRRQDAAATTAAADGQPQSPQQTSTKAANPAKSKRKQPVQKKATSKKPTKQKRSNKTGSTTEEQVSAVKRGRRLKDLRSHSHRHAVITRVLELGRVEFRLRDVREKEEGEWKGMVEVSGVGWQAKAAAAERKRRRKRGKRSGNLDASDGDGADLDSPSMVSPRPMTSASGLSTDTPNDSAAVTTRSGAALSKTELDDPRLTAAHLTMNPFSLFSSRQREKRSELQLLLMTEKERQQFLEDEERKERIRRDKEDRERKKWSRKVGELWFELRLLPLDADGQLVVREGEKRSEDRAAEEVKEEEAAEEGEEQEGVEEADEEEDEVDEDEEEVVEGRTTQKSRTTQLKSDGKRDRTRGQTGRSRAPETEYLSQQQLRSKAFPVMD